jgi:hypothetical protein
MFVWSGVWQWVALGGSEWGGVAGLAVRFPASEVEFHFFCSLLFPLRVLSGTFFAFLFCSFHALYFYICIFACLHVCIFAYLHIFIFAYLHIYIFAYLQNQSHLYSMD